MDPTYDRTLISLRTFGAEVEGVPLTAEGMDVDALERALGAGPAPRLVYSIPTYQNPAGVTLPAEARRRLVELCRAAGVLLLEDDPYGLLRFEGDAEPSLHELDGGDNVIYSSSFTKTVAPGLRTGYLVLPERLTGPLAKISENTTIGPNSFAEATLNAYCRAGRFEPNVELATAALRERRDAMEAGLREHFPEGARWTTPRGGYFYWVRPARVAGHGRAAGGGDRARRPLRQGCGLPLLGRWRQLAAARFQRRVGRADRRGRCPAGRAACRGAGSGDGLARRQATPAATCGRRSSSGLRTSSGCSTRRAWRGETISPRSAGRKVGHGSARSSAHRLVLRK